MLFAGTLGSQNYTKKRPSAGEQLGVFTLESYWPILAALGSALLVCGLVFIPGVSFAALLAGAALVAWTARFLVREST